MTHNTTTDDRADTSTTTAEAALPSNGLGFVLTAAAAGAAVSVAAGVYGNLHTPTGDVVTTFGFNELLAMKAWFASGAAALALAQVATAMWMWGRLPRVARGAPAWTAPAHRWLGTAAFLLTLPVAYHCLWSMGFQDTTARVLIHSLLGCAFYGAFVTKMLVLRSDRVPARTVPIVGGLLAAILVTIWWTSSFWFFTNVGFPT